MRLLCREVRPGEVAQDVTQRDQFNTDEVDLTATLIRESHQNSADARSTINRGPVITRIRMVEPRESYREYFEQVFEGLAPHLRESEIDLDGIDLGLPRILIIEDFGTTGLTGDFELDEDMGPFNNFWRRIGRSEKNGSKLGRWGLGKLVLSSASRIHTFFGLTVREDDPDRRLLMGQSVLKYRRIDGIKYAPHIFFAEPRADGLQLPVSDKVEVDKFAEAVGLTRADEPGLSIAIPFVRPGIEISTLIPEVLKNYFFPILTGKLVVEIGGESITDSTFDEIANRYNWQGNESNSQMLSFIRDIRAAESTAPDVILGNGWTSNMETSIAVPELERIRELFSTGSRVVHVRAPLTLTNRTKKSGLTHIDLYMRRTSDASKGGALYVRGDITVPDEVRYFTPRQTLAALVARDSVVVSFLGDAENPAHTKWNGNADKLGNWAAASTRLREIRNSLSRLQTMLLQAVNNVEPDALKEIFSLEDSAAVATNTPPKKSDVRKPFVPIVATSKRVFSINDQAGGFTVRAASGLTEEMLPLTLKITFAYDVLRGDPFKKFSEFDFDLTKSTPAIDAEGASLVTSTPNHFVAECSAMDFAIRCKGLDPMRDVIVKVVKSS